MLNWHCIICKKQVLLNKPANTPTESTTSSHSHTIGHDISVYTRVEEKSSIDFSQIIGDLDEKRAELAILQQVLVQKEKQIETLQGKMADSSANNSPPKEMEDLKEQLKGRDDELESMRNSVIYYRIQNSDLQSKVGSLETRVQQQQNGEQLVESSRESRVTDLESQVESYKTQVEQLQESAKRTSTDEERLEIAKEKWEGEIETALQQAFPNVKIKQSTRNEEFISIFKKELVQVVQTQAAASSSAASETPASDNADVSRLQAQVSHYQQVLADTETILNQLQNSVESEEQNWKQKVVSLEDENNRLKKSSAPRDMEDKVKELEERLSSSESEKLSLQSKLSESSVSLHSIKAELDILRTSPATREDLLQELGESRKREKEMKKENSKLSGVVKMGQDEFKREQDLVKSLQQQIKAHSLSNGTSPESELEKKLKQSEAQLEREVQANKQLTQRLAMYGCFSAK